MFVLNTSSVEGTLAACPSRPVRHFTLPNNCSISEPATPLRCPFSRRRRAVGSLRPGHCRPIIVCNRHHWWRRRAITDSPAAASIGPCDGQVRCGRRDSTDRCRSAASTHLRVFTTPLWCIARLVCARGRLVRPGEPAGVRGQRPWHLHRQDAHVHHPVSPHLHVCAARVRCRRGQWLAVVVKRRRVDSSGDGGSGRWVRPRDTVGHRPVRTR